MTTPKRPGWGLRIHKVRSTNRTPEALNSHWVRHTETSFSVLKAWQWPPLPT
ncbi:hypothetical protein LBMAG41_11220 [Cyanobium sp.]|nr:hypothetical protein LBMAG41_11220 [Cyanobium sp.]